jgi:hypothetical protein
MARGNDISDRIRQRRADFDDRIRQRRADFDDRIRQRRADRQQRIDDRNSVTNEVIEARFQPPPPPEEPERLAELPDSRAFGDQPANAPDVPEANAPDVPEGNAPDVPEANGEVGVDVATLVNRISILEGMVSSLQTQTDESEHGNEAMVIRSPWRHDAYDGPFAGDVSNDGATLTINEGIIGAGSNAVFWWPDSETTTIAASAMSSGWNWVYFFIKVDPFDGEFADNALMKPVLQSAAASGYTNLFGDGVHARQPIGLAFVADGKITEWVQRLTHDFCVPVTQRKHSSGGGGTEYYATWHNVDDENAVSVGSDTSPSIDGATPTRFT